MYIGDFLSGPAHLRSLLVLVKLKEWCQIFDMTALSEEVLVGCVVLQQI